MQAEKKANILGCQVDLVDAGQALERIENFIEIGKPAHVITLNAEIVYEARTNIELNNIINQAHLVTPDGIGIVWGGRKLGYQFQERVTGIDLLYQLCDRAAVRGWSVYLLGSAPGVAESAARRLQEKYNELKVCGIHDGYFKQEDIPALIKEIRGKIPQILFVALGAPSQEFWIQEYKDLLEVPVCIGVGGSFDVISGNKKRAPSWMIALNIEWLYRLLSEPSRLKRQMVLPRFVAAIFAEKRKLRRMGRE
ncbi:MAG: WecB/TagA/CpsF family glycosyltransferase [Bacillota bacterium]|nr:WecB/TagA/CpsF family glycosyltransferase [Bacillota bacterium]